MRATLARQLPAFKQLPHALWSDFLEGKIKRNAMALVYATLLSVVPLLALSFSVLKSFGVHNQMEPVVRNLLSPLGASADEFTQQLLGFVDNVQVGVLGAAGLLTLVYTVMALMQSIEDAFNEVWLVSQPRPFWIQVRDYLSVVFLTPVVIVSLFGLWHSLGTRQEVQQLIHLQPFGQLLAYFVYSLPILFIISAFTFLYIFVPHTKVHFWPALSGAILAGLAWTIAARMFASFIVGSGQQIAIYSIFANLFLFMLWLFVGWFIVLMGAKLAYYFQYPGSIILSQQPREASLQTREILAALILQEIGQRFIKRQPPPTLEALHTRIPVPRLLIENSLAELIHYGILRRDDQNPAHYLLSVPPDQVTVAELRRYFWQGTVKQQAQAHYLIQQAKLKPGWLLEIAASPNHTLQQLLDETPEQNTV